MPLYAVGSQLVDVREPDGVANQFGLVPSPADSSDVCARVRFAEFSEPTAP